jgi:small-conductance mechanosensitive channel
VAVLGLQPVELFGVRLIGLSGASGRKILLSAAVVAGLFLLNRLVQVLAGRIFRDHKRPFFWTVQAAQLAALVLGVLAVVSIWFEDTSHFATVAGLASAGVAFALQRVITAFAGYLVILRGKTMRVGDRIAMAGVRGDVVALGFIRTTIMEMGQPEGDSQKDEAVWVASRQYTGRIVTVTNDKIFDQPVYNYTRDFPYIFEEMRLPVPYTSDRKRAERILLDAAGRQTVSIREIGEPALRELERRFFMRRAEMGPRVYYRLTDNWIEMTVRFLAPAQGVRDLKDRMSREILDGLEQAGIPVASSTFEVVGLPPLRIAEADAGGDAAKSSLPASSAARSRTS